MEHTTAKAMVRFAETYDSHADLVNVVSSLDDLYM